ELQKILNLPQSDIDVGLLGLESEGFVLRGKFHPNASEQEWCDRRLLARIHRLTIDRLRAEIQPVSAQDFYRFLFAWQRVDAEHRVEVGCCHRKLRMRCPNSPRSALSPPIVSMVCAPCSFRRTNGRRLDATKGNAGAKPILRASSSPGAGRC